jgi:hypothetical protein
MTTVALPAHLQQKVTLAQFGKVAADEEARLAEQERQAALDAQSAAIRAAIALDVDPFLAQYVEVPSRLGLLSLHTVWTFHIEVPGYTPIAVEMQRKADRWHVIPCMSRFGTPFGVFGVGEKSDGGVFLRWSNDIGEALLMASEAQR